VYAPPLPSSLSSIPGLNAALTPVAIPQEPHLLSRLQSPMDSLHRLIDQWLIAHGYTNNVFLWLVNLLVAIAITLVVAWLAGTACRKLGLYLEKRQAQLSASLLLIAAPVLRWVLLLTGLSDTVEDAWPATKGLGLWIAGGLFILAVILAVRGVTAVARTVLQKLLAPRLAQATGEDPESGDSATRLGSRGLVPLIQQIAGLLLWLAGLILVLDHFGQNVSSVVAALGVTSLAIGLASQQALSNIIAGLVLALDHPFRVGDRIRLPGLDGGEVLDIGMRATQIRLSDGSLLIVPNSDLVSARLVNQSVEHAVRAEVRLTLPLTLDVDLLSAFLVEAANKVEPHPLHDRPPRVHLLSITDKLELSLIVWLPRHAEAPRLEEQLRRVALRHIQQLMATSAAATTAAPAPAPAAAPAPAPVGLRTTPPGDATAPTNPVTEHRTATPAESAAPIRPHSLLANSGRKRRG
jgi:small-conductance mechanosensitive channel